MIDNPDKRIALLIDADNAPAGKIDVVLAEVARYGVANVRRAYGNWKSPHLKSWEAALHEYAIRPIQQFAYSSGKNASDMAMVIDAMDLLYARNLDGFAIVSSDADFTPLVMRLLTDGMKVYGFGEKKTPAPFVNACSKFTYVEALGEQAAAASDTAAGRKDATALRGDTRLVQMLRNAIDSACEDDGWAHLGRWASRWPTRPHSTHATTVIANSATWCVRSACSRSSRTSRPCGCAMRPRAGGRKQRSQRPPSPRRRPPRSVRRARGPNRQRGNDDG